MKRISRKRYAEQLRDRFEAAGVPCDPDPGDDASTDACEAVRVCSGCLRDEDGVVFSAILLGKFLRFLAWALITIFFGPTILNTGKYGQCAHGRWPTCPGSRGYSGGSGRGLGGAQVIRIGGAVRIFPQKKNCRMKPVNRAV